MLEAILELLGEFILQAVLEGLLEMGFHSVAEPFRIPPKPWLAALGYFTFGAVLGALSLWMLPAHLTPPPWRIANLIATPLAVGALMAILGRWRARRGDPLFRIDRFFYGYLFAFSFALVRFAFAK